MTIKIVFTNYEKPEYHALQLDRRFNNSNRITFAKSSLQRHSASGFRRAEGSSDIIAFLCDRKFK